METVPHRKHIRQLRSTLIISDEGEEQKRGPQSTGEGERRVPGAREAAAAAERHHEPAGQGEHHPPYDELPQDEARLPRR